MKPSRTTITVSPITVRLLKRLVAQLLLDSGKSLTMDETIMFLLGHYSSFNRTMKQVSAPSYEEVMNKITQEINALK